MEISEASELSKQHINTTVANNNTNQTVYKISLYVAAEIKKL